LGVCLAHSNCISKAKYVVSNRPTGNLQTHPPRSLSPPAATSPPAVGAAPPSVYGQIHGQLRRLPSHSPSGLPPGHLPAPGRKKGQEGDAAAGSSQPAPVSGAGLLSRRVCGGSRQAAPGQWGARCIAESGADLLLRGHAVGRGKRCRPPPLLLLTGKPWGCARRRRPTDRKARWL
jgi:hypothetical protein